jgi:hypothetical protein
MVLLLGRFLSPGQSLARVLGFLFSFPESLSTQDVLKVLSWLDYYNAELESIMAKQGDDADRRQTFRCLEFDDAARLLLAEFMARMRSQLTAWLDSVIILKHDLITDDGRFVTSYPNDMYPK